MKKLILLALITLNFATAYSATEKIGSIKEKGGSREIVISQETDEQKQDIVFTLKDKAITSELNRISYAEYAEGTELRGKYSTYNFKLVKTGLKVTGDLYHACWKEEGLAGLMTTGIFGGFALMINVPVGFYMIGGSLSLCTVVPAIPAAVLSVALLPLDALITGTKSIVSTEAIANRKLEKAMSGDDKKTSKKAFNLILKRIINL